MTTLFAITLFWSAALLFWVEPMVGKLVLPQLGGAPSVWNTCMVFFQAMLLAGYAAAHWMAGNLSPRAQLGTHLALLLTALATLPIKLNESTAAPWQDWPTAWLLVRLLVGVGPAFFVLALTTPLLQRWFAASGDARARDRLRHHCDTAPPAPDHACSPQVCCPRAGGWRTVRAARHLAAPRTSG